jgi:APA family basic amino acid/polyamine antiporter
VSDFRSAVHTLSSQGIDYHSVIPSICGIPFCINLPAILIILFITLTLIRGTKDSTKFAAFMVALKLGIIALFVISGFFFVKPENWVPFAPNGFSGIFMGAFIIFFAYIGFDALATTAEECKNPQRDLPRGIIGSLIVTTIVYTLVALVLTGMYRTQGDVNQAFIGAPLAFAMENVLHGWAAKAVPGFMSIGIIAGLTSVLLVMQMAATRILYAMSRDHFIPAVFQKLHPKTNTPHILTWAVCIVSIFGTLTLNLDAAAALCNFGTFTSFIIVCVAILILRKIDPNRPRPFKVPFCPWFPLAGILCCGGLMTFMMVTAKGNSAKLSTELFFAWIIMGILIYLTYGYRKNRQAELKDEK